jgi:hypothetical protein
MSSRMVRQPLVASSRTWSTGGRLAEWARTRVFLLGGAGQALFGVVFVCSTALIVVTDHTPSIPAEVGPTLRAARVGAGVSLTQLARQAGVRVEELRRFEAGARPVTTVFYGHLIAAMARLVETQRTC